MKLAAMEGLYEGKTNAGLVAVGMLTPGKKYNDSTDAFVFKFEIPKLLSMLSYRDVDAFVPGVKDVVDGYIYMDAEGNGQLALSAQQKISRGRVAIQALADYRKAKKNGNKELMNFSKMVLEQNFQYFGYGYLNDPESIIPNVPLTFYSFHIMVALGFYFIILFVVVLWLIFKQQLQKHRWLLRLLIVSVPLAYIASEAGWIVAEVGRQPWVIQDLLPTVAAVSRIDASAVQITFWLFGILFSVLLIAEMKILFKQIKIGPNEGGH